MSQILHRTPVEIQRAGWGGVEKAVRAPGGTEIPFAI
jgi:hypothetical protein